MVFKNKIFLLTEDLSFFYKLNKELNRLNIKFNILNIGNKLPTFSSLILTTSKEINKFERHNQKNIFLPYSSHNGFERFISKVIAAYRIGYKENYSNLTFSIDPGTKHIGLVIFLDNYYFLSHTIYDKKELINKIKNYTKNFDNPNLIKLSFKFGRGVLPLTIELVNKIFTAFKNRGKMRVYLIDEAKSSKIRIYYQGKSFPKDEASALILALRDGIEVNQNNFQKIFNQIKSKKLKKEELRNDLFEKNNDMPSILREIAEKVLNGEVSLSESIENINKIKINAQEYDLR